MGFFRKKERGGDNGDRVWAEMQRVTRDSRILMGVLLLFMVGFFVYTFFFGQKALAPLLEPTRFSMMDLDGEVHGFAYADAEYIELRSDFRDFDRGEKLSGSETRSSVSGVYRNGEFGEYRLMAMKKLKNYIVVHLPEETLVLNYESDSTTEELFRSFTEDSGYTGP